MFRVVAGEAGVQPVHRHRSSFLLHISWLLPAEWLAVSVKLLLRLFCVVLTRAIDLSSNIASDLSLLQKLRNIMAPSMLPLLVLAAGVLAQNQPRQV
jgi:hypothetical protein